MEVKSDTRPLRRPCLRLGTLERILSATCWAPNWCERPKGFAYRFGSQQLNLHGPGFVPAEVARLPVQPGNSDLCFDWPGPIDGAIAHLGRCEVAIERGPMKRFGAKGPGRASISATRTARCWNSSHIPVR